MPDSYLPKDLTPTEKPEPYLNPPADPQEQKTVIKGSMTIINDVELRTKAAQIVATANQGRQFGMPATQLVSEARWVELYLRGGDDATGNNLVDAGDDASGEAAKDT